MDTSQHGFSLLETIVAVALLAGAVTGLLSLFTLTTTANREARHASLAVMLAGSKLEELRSSPSAPAAGPAGSLTANTAGFCDLLGADGATLGTCSAPAQSALYVRRWSIEARGSGPIQVTVLRVAVSWNRGAARNSWAGLHADEVQLATLRTEDYR